MKLGSTANTTVTKVGSPQRLSEAGRSGQSPNNRCAGSRALACKARLAQEMVMTHTLNTAQTSARAGSRSATH